MQEFLEDLFGDAEGAVGIYHENGEDITDYETPAIAANAVSSGDYIDLTTDRDLVVAVVDHEFDLEKATLCLVKDDQIIPVIVFENPISLETFSTAPSVKTLENTIPAPLSPWKVVYKSGTYYDFETLYLQGDTNAATNSPIHDDNPFIAASDVQVDDGDDDDQHEIPIGPSPDVVASLEDDGEFLREVTRAPLPPVEPEFWQDAEIIGEITPELDAFLDQPAIFMTGKVHESSGKPDRRNTQSGGWTRVEVPWRVWLDGGPATPGNDEWGLLRHPVAREKGGSAIIMAETLDGERLKTAVDTFYAMGIDIDSGDDIDDVIDKVEKLGLFCLVYTSYNHGKNVTRVKQATVMQKLRIKEEPDLNDVKMYLREHQKGKYDANFISHVTIKEIHRDPREGIVIDLETLPMQKFRLIFPLAKPIKMLDLAPTIDGACAVWENKVTGLAHKILGVNFDAACTDVTRVFYTPRHPKNADCYSAIITGKPLDFSDIPEFKKTAYIRLRDGNDNAFSVAGGDDDKVTIKDCFAPSGMSLNRWHTKFKERFMLADALEAYCPDKIRDTGAEASGHVHTECPFEHLHSKSGGTATMAMNALDNNLGYWTWFCHHDSCQGTSKIEFIEQALKDGWFDEDVLLNQEFLAAAEDDDEEDEEAAYSDERVEKTFEQMAEDEFDKKSNEDSIRAFIASIRRTTKDMTVWNSIKAILIRNTMLTATNLSSMWKQIDAAQAALDRSSKEADPKTFDGIPVIGQTPDRTMVNYAHKCLDTANKEDPYLFRYMRNIVRISEEGHGQCYIESLDGLKFAYELNEVAPFEQRMGDAGKRIVFAPKAIVNHLYASTMPSLPDLRGVITTPTFSPDGKIVSQEGYDDKSKLFYNPDLTLAVPKVSKTPTDDEVYEAKRLIIEEVLGDFPLGGHTRETIIDTGLNGEGIPAVSNMVGLILLPFVREMIDGPTPGHLLTKPTPGSGATLLSECMHMITQGNRGAATAFPSGRNASHEINQTLFAMFSNGSPTIWFDNINSGIDSGELAMAMTAPVYNARVLGKSQTIPVDVRCAWLFTGNNIIMSHEMLRRLCMIDLDPQVAHPEQRTGWRHKDIIGWLRDNRGELVWACLTLTQNWIAKGRPLTSTMPVASYENWVLVIGGILEHAGIGGFMENRTELHDRASDGTEDVLEALINLWWVKFGEDGITCFGDGSVAGDEGIADMAIKDGIFFPDIRSTGSGEYLEYDRSSFGKFISKLNGRVFELKNDGLQVKLEKDKKRNSHGVKWKLRIVGRI